VVCLLSKNKPSWVLLLLCDFCELTSAGYVKLQLVQNLLNKNIFGTSTYASISTIAFHGGRQISENVYAGGLSHG
jgi:hypothetical protein